MLTVLSLFDGISCGQLALKRLGIPYTCYASEIDRNAIAVTQANFPDTVQLGDVRLVKNQFGIDLLMGGSPCQSFSVAGDQQGFSGESGLFYEYARIFKECKPKWFLFENVQMKKEWRDEISSHLGVEPIVIDSSILSAQCRKRLYWTNMEVGKIGDKGLVLADILENPKKIENKYDKPVRVGTVKSGGQGDRVYGIFGKGICLSASSGGTAGPANMLIDDGGIRKLSTVEVERLQTLPDGYTDHNLSKNQRHKLIGNGWTVDIIKHILGSIVL